MDDDIKLTPIPSIIGAPGMNLWIDDLRRAAVLADRERRAKVDAKPVVHSVRLMLKPDGGSWFPMGDYGTAKGEIGVTIRWTADGRAWIDSERNRELARRLRIYPSANYNTATAMSEAADALDGGER